MDSNVSIGSRISVSGTVVLILADGFTLTAPKGIKVASGDSLTIYGQTNNTGTLTINGVDEGNAGIGGSNSAGGTIKIFGGTVNATGGFNGAGIGGGNKGAGGTIKIFGGNVTAKGGQYGAGIGGGNKGEGGNITINGGTVNATCDSEGAGIGGGMYGSGGNITINGGTVNATCGFKGAGIGGGMYGSGGNITITGGKVNATGGHEGAGIGGGCYGAGGNITITGGNVTATGGWNGAGIGGGLEGGGGTISLGWTNTTDSIHASSYDGTATLKSGFLIDGADPETAALPGNIGGKKIVASNRVHAVTADEGITAVPWALEGSTVTLTSKKGYDAVYTVNGTAIEGDTFTMPEEDATITATFTPIAYTLTYELNGGTASNPTSYTVEDDFKLTNPTRDGYTLTGWTGTELDGATLTVTIPAGSTGAREYAATWGRILPLKTRTRPNLRTTHSYSADRSESYSTSTYLTRCRLLTALWILTLAGTSARTIRARNILRSLTRAASNFTASSAT